LSFDAFRRLRDLDFGRQRRRALQSSGVDR
jgi:hypothetical protein